ncbi:MAG TPA: PepSY-like domain-containing protein [Flavitalea sp.]|nr:PepSY-like domain-containing protein [Flavitalea sp.]
MRKTMVMFLVLAGIFTAGSSYAQLRKIPAEVTEAFKDKYAMANDLEWRDKLRGFQASFELNGQKHLANFTNDGIWESTETEIDVDDLPSVVKDSYEKSKYSEWEIGIVQKIEMPEEKIQYRVQAVKSDIRKKNLYFSTEGRLLKDKLTL